MCFTYSNRDLAETMAPRSAAFYGTPFAVFESRSSTGDSVTCTCPLDCLACSPTDILVIYEPAS